MGDEDTAELNKKLLQRQPRIVIRKCKKPPPGTVLKTSTDIALKPTDDSKKVNGELLTENKTKSDTDDEVEIIQPKKQDSRFVNRDIKRKGSAIDLENDDCAIIEANLTVNESRNDDGSEGKEENLIEFKGFKKRIIAQTEKLKDDLHEQGKNSSIDDEVIIQEPVKLPVKAKNTKLYKGKNKNGPNGKKNNVGDGEDNQAESQAEYAQYLGLQPTMQFKCYRCGEKGFPSMLALNMHQRGCGVSQKANFLANLQQDTTNMSSSDPNMLTNFRITRKVYLCSACGTYYENWNLFLHMRDVHKKHICLYCLTMFTVANKLADHLLLTHSVQENSFKTSEEFQNTFKGSCYLICCDCENMFTERDDYHHHDCAKKDPTAKCPLCGVKCGHYYTCPNSNLPRTSSVSVTVSPTPTVSKSQASNLNKPVNKNSIADGRWMNKKNQGGLSSDNDEDYDISHAASFCHVDIADDSGEKNRAPPEDNIIDITDDETLKGDNNITEINQETLQGNNSLGDNSNITVGVKDKEDIFPTSQISGSNTSVVSSVLSSEV